MESKWCSIIFPYPTKSPGNKSLNFSGFLKKRVFPRGSQKVWKLGLGGDSFLLGCSFGEVVFSNSCDKRNRSSPFHPVFSARELSHDLTWSCLVPAAATHFDSPKCEAGMERGKVTKVKNEGAPKMPILYFDTAHNATVDGRNPAQPGMYTCK